MHGNPGAEVVKFAERESSASTPRALPNDRDSARLSRCVHRVPEAGGMLDSDREDRASEVEVPVPESFEPALSGSPDQKGSSEALQNRVLAAIPERVRSARQGARERGERYYMGASCPRGHNGLRYVSNGVCVECVVR